MFCFVSAIAKEQSMNNHQKLTLIIGGTGKTGQRVARRLRQRDVPVRVGSRSGEPRFDWYDRETWLPALSGARALYLTYYPDLAVPQAAADIRDLSRLASESGVEQIVLLSGRGEP